MPKDLSRILQLKYPSKKNYQKKIVSILETIDQAIEKTEALIHKHQQIKAGLMHDLFTRGVTADGTLRPPREKSPELYKETPMGWIPKEWTTKTLGEYAGVRNIVNGPFGSDLLCSELKDEGVPVLYVQDIKPGYFKRISSAYVTIAKANTIFFCNVQFGDILVAKVGSPPCDSCVYLSDRKAIVTQDVIRIRPLILIDSEFVSSYLNSLFGQKNIRKISIEGTRQRVSLTEFKTIKIPVVNHIEKQVIGKILKNIKRLIEKEQVNLEKLIKQKSGLMQDLLTGRVRVKVDQEEPVHV